jgi:hypothetical protein
MVQGPSMSLTGLVPGASPVRRFSRYPSDRRMYEPNGGELFGGRTPIARLPIAVPRPIVF